MVNTKELSSIELSSLTTIGMGIYVLISVILAIIAFIALMVIGGSSAITTGLMLIPMIIFGAILYSIIHFFGRGYLYNVLVTRLNAIDFDIEEGEITRINPISTSLVIGVISLICFIIVYTLAYLVVPGFASSVLQTLMASGQMNLALIVYNFLVLMLSPQFFIACILLSFVLTFIFVCLQIYVYNYISPKVGGIIVDFKDEGKYTSLKYVDPKSAAIIVSICSLVVDVIVSIAMLAINHTAVLYALYNIISGFVITFVLVFLIAYFYNYLAPKMGQLKLELE
ncbi:hypothetical protein [uncultured Methanobrevibacter sp.]|uniref:hypothetical protein n=1 Tax=uncultured Methanobrevibacter sp. TaxID=253161 RepID=UPI00258FFB80|nr:hypothetical protein [uncultured Methanobrevibacter sp.]